jgi:hypothetical protein
MLLYKTKNINASLNNEMKISFMYFTTILLFITFNSYVFGQSNFGIKINSVSYSFIKSENSQLYVNALNKSKSLLVEPGIILNYEKFLSGDFFSFKIEQGVFKDRMNNVSAYTQIALSRKIFQSYKSSFAISLGPAVLYRKTWTLNPQYENEFNYNKTNNLDYKIQILSAELMYAFQLGSKTDFSVSIKYFQPYAFNPTIGMRYWFNKKVRRKKGCISCPAFH